MKKWAAVLLVVCCVVADERKDLYWALRTRVLTKAEMEMVRAYDWELVVIDHQPFYEIDAIKEFNSALLNQFTMQLAASNPCRDSL